MAIFDVTKGESGTLQNFRYRWPTLFQLLEERFSTQIILVCTDNHFNEYG